MAAAVYPWPNRDDSYDAVDYDVGDDHRGTLGEFVGEVDRRGIRVIVDLVVDHGSDQQLWFQKARQGHETYCDFHVWIDGPEVFAHPTESDHRMVAAVHNLGGAAAEATLELVLQRSRYRSAVSLAFVRRQQRHARDSCEW